jgi:dipeptidyl aminopeptidase/acylaminoacyl peptidase
LTFWLAAPDARADEDMLVFSVRRWEGRFESRDVPGGVRTTPTTASIYLVRADGSGLRRVVSIDGAECAAPAFSPDGKWLFFQSNASGHYQLYRCRPDGTDREQLTSAERPGPPWISTFGLQVTTDGRLLCTVHDGRSGRVAVASPDGWDVKLVAPDLGYLYMSAMSPGGDALVCSGPANGYRLWLLGLPDAFLERGSRSNAPVVDLTPNHPESFVPQFTPDGRTIVFLRRDGDIYRVQSDGSGLRRLTEGNRHVEFRLSPQDRHGSTDGPHLSPNGRRIAYVAVRDGVPNVCTVDIEGSTPRQLTFRKTPCGRVRWSPDGRRVAFVSFEGRYPQLFLVAADGGELDQLTHLDGAVYTIGWKPR